MRMNMDSNALPLLFLLGMVLVMLVAIGIARLSRRSKSRASVPRKDDSDDAEMATAGALSAFPRRIAGAAVADLDGDDD